MSFELAAEIKKRYGFVRRARGCYLYTEKNVRLTDCFLDGGRALLGWDGGKARTVFKDTLERGANGSYCGGYESRLATAVRHLLPDEYTEIRWYYYDCALLGAPRAADGAACVSGARDSVSGVSGATREGASGTPANRESGASGANSADPIENNARFGAVLWRPWLDICATVEPKPTRYPEITITHPGVERPDVIKLVPPFAWATSLTIYAFRDAATLTTDAQSGQVAIATPTQPAAPQTRTVAQTADPATSREIPPSDVVPAPLLAAYARAFYDLKTSLGTFGENDFKCFAKQLSPLFDRRACWLFPKIPRDSYEDFAKRCLDAGIVMSPHYDVPSIIPWRANKGDIKRIADCI